MSEATENEVVCRRDLRGQHEWTGEEVEQLHPDTLSQAAFIMRGAAAALRATGHEITWARPLETYAEILEPGGRLPSEGGEDIADCNCAADGEEHGGMPTCSQCEFVERALSGEPPAPRTWEDAVLAREERVIAVLEDQGYVVLRGGEAERLEMKLRGAASMLSSVDGEYADSVQIWADILAERLAPPAEPDAASLPCNCVALSEAELMDAAPDEEEEEVATGEVWSGCVAEEHPCARCPVVTAECVAEYVKRHTERVVAALEEAGYVVLSEGNAQSIITILEIDAHWLRKSGEASSAEFRIYLAKFLALRDARQLRQWADDLAPRDEAVEQHGAEGEYRCVQCGVPRPMGSSEAPTRRCSCGGMAIVWSEVAPGNAAEKEEAKQDGE